jgi:hypothetical protein
MCYVYGQQDTAIVLLGSVITVQTLESRWTGRQVWKWRKYDDCERESMIEAPSQGVRVIFGFDKLYTWKRHGGKTIAEEGRQGEATSYNHAELKAGGERAKRRSSEIAGARALPKVGGLYFGMLAATTHIS